jgi:hypothetical protein
MVYAKSKLLFKVTLPASDRKRGGTGCWDYVSPLLAFSSAFVALTISFSQGGSDLSPNPI